MTQSKAAAIADLQTKARALTGMREAPAKLTEAANQFPFAVCYERAADTTLMSAGFADDLATVYLEFHVSRTLLQEAINTSQQLTEAFLLALVADPQLSNSVQTINGPIHRTFGKLSWGGTDTIGTRFEIQIKFHMDNKGA